MQEKARRSTPKSPTRRKAEKIPDPPVVSLAKPETPSAALTPLNFRVPETFHRSFKIYAAQHGISMVDLLQASFKAMKERRTK